MSTTTFKPRGNIFQIFLLLLVAAALPLIWYLLLDPGLLGRFIDVVGQNRALSSFDDPLLLRQTPPPNITNIIFIKTSKTGGTTIGSLFFRFGLRHDLKFLTLSDETAHFATPETPPCEDCNISLYHDHNNGDRRMLNESQYRRLVPTGHFVTVVREPMSRHLSDYYYFHQSQTDKHNPAVVLEFRASGKRTFDLASSLDVVPIHEEEEADREPARVDARIEEQLSQFSIVLVLERLDESLVVMKRRFGWQLEDLLYLPVNEGCNHPRPWDGVKVICPLKLEDFDEDTIHSMKHTLRFDFKIYEASVRKLDEMIAEQDPLDFAADLTLFKEMNRRLRKACSQNDPEWFRKFQCDLYQLSDHPGGYEKLARDCSMSEFRQLGQPPIACRVLKHHLVPFLEDPTDASYWSHSE